MAELVFVTAQGDALRVSADPGQSIMRIARSAGIPGIYAECGGDATCGTCHCLVDYDRLDELPEPGPDEQAVIEGLICGEDNSRLTCQIRMTDALDGLELTIPRIQG